MAIPKNIFGSLSHLVVTAEFKFLAINWVNQSSACCRCYECSSGSALEQNGLVNSIIKIISFVVLR